MWLMALFAVLLAAPGLAQVGQQEAHVEAKLISSMSAIAPGEEWVVGIKLVHDEHWHTYWKYPGTGLATNVEWELPDGFTAGPLEWPTPMRFEFAGAVGYGYESEVVLITRIQTPDDLAMAGR